MIHRFSIIPICLILAFCLLSMAAYTHAEEANGLEEMKRDMDRMKREIERRRAQLPEREKGSSIIPAAPESMRIGPNEQIAIDWLTGNMESDGHWDATKYGGKSSHDIFVTAAAFDSLLRTDQLIPTDSNFKKTVSWLLSQADEDGMIGSDENAAMALLALADATKDIAATEP